MENNMIAKYEEDDFDCIEDSEIKEEIKKFEHIDKIADFLRGNLKIKGIEHIEDDQEVIEIAIEYISSKAKGVNFFRQDPFEVIEGIMDCESKSLCLPYIIDKLGPKINQVLNTEEKEYAVLNYLYNLGQHKSRSRSIDKALLGIWESRWRRFSKKIDFINMDMLEPDKQRMSFIEKVIEVIANNASLESIIIIDRILDDLTSIEIKEEKESTFITKGSRFFKKKQSYNYDEIRRYREKIITKIALDITQIVVSYDTVDNEIRDMFIYKANTIRNLFENLYQYSNELNEGARRNIQSRIEDATIRIDSIYIEICNQVKDTKTINYIQKNMIDYIVLSSSVTRKRAFLDYLNNAKDRLDNGTAKLILYKFIENEKEENEDITLYAFGILKKMIVDCNNSGQLKNDSVTLGDIGQKLKGFINVGIIKADSEILRNRHSKVLEAIDEIIDSLDLSYVLEFIELTFDKLNSYEDAVCRTYNTFEKIIKERRANSYNEISANEQRVKKVFHSIFCRNNENSNMSYSAVAMYYELYGLNESLGYLKRNSQCIHENIQRSFESKIEGVKEYSKEELLYIFDYFGHAVSESFKRDIINRFKKILTEDRQYLIEKFNVDEFIELLGVELVMKKDNKEYLSTVKPAILDTLKLYKNISKEKYYELIEGIFLKYI